MPLRFVFNSIFDLFLCIFDNVTNKILVVLCMDYGRCLKFRRLYWKVGDWI